jgi:hypothetical protein
MAMAEGETTPTPEDQPEVLALAPTSESTPVPPVQVRETKPIEAFSPTRSGPFAASVGFFYDTRDYTTLNLTTFTGRLPLGFNIWGFVDLSSGQDAGDERFDLSRYFIEYRLRWQAPGALSQLGLELEFNDMPGTGNALVRFGPNYKLPLSFLAGSWLQFRALPIQSAGRSSQLSLIHSLRFGPHVSMEGFTDVNIPWDGSPARVVTESMLQWHATRYLGFGVEVRYNGFEDAADGVAGLGVAFAAVATL